MQSSRQVEPQEIVEMTFAADVSPNISCASGEIRIDDEALQEQERKQQQVELPKA